MKATLVSHYGRKHDNLVNYLSTIQSILSSRLGTSFTPYAIEQIHATIIGFESACKLPVQDRVDPASILGYLRSPEIPAIQIQIGGYRQFTEYGFQSQGQHPSLRCFSVQNDIAVAMGWPVNGVNILDRFRRSFNRFNLYHKWHQADDDIDNDFYFVVGKVNRPAVDNRALEILVQEIRDYMAVSPSIMLHVGADTLSIVGYSDRELPCETTIVHPLNDSTFTAADFFDYLVDRKPDNLV